jgi:2-polyprenyl-3-methyl-5-hydroxy-6-metoxy-1,4-benzoquinol methylase
MPTDYEIERQFFNRMASQAVLRPMSQATLERYACPRWPHLFAKEMMFALAGDLRGKRVLEVGCGEGTASVQLASCGGLVTGLDISDESIRVARQRAALQGVEAEFQIRNVTEAGSLGEECYDVVWCDLILHHLVDSLDRVMGNLKRALKPGGWFIAREPIAYAGWLKALRKLVPVRVDATPDEQPFRPSEFAVVRQHFPNLRLRHYRLLARADRVTRSLPLLRLLARVDNLLLWLPGSKALAGNVVMWGSK